LRELRVRRESPLEQILAPEPPLDPMREPQRTLDQLADLVDVGATGFSLRFVHRSRVHYIEQLAALQEILAAG
jgi:hypothetical protein